jgi:signal transduction histidine kinase
MERNQDRFKIVLASLWLAFTVALATWWLIFGLRQLDRLHQLSPEQVQHHSRMLFWEGGVLIALLLIGGVALITYIWRERQRQRQNEEFFSAFTHDAKTALASLRLQAESLCEDTDPPNPFVERLLKDTVRLQLQLENSLFLANLPSGRLLSEPLRLSRIVESLRFHWPELALHWHGDAQVLADIRALESILSNLIQNAVTHGGARTINLFVTTTAGYVQVQVADDGRGFAGNFQQLGVRFYRHTPTSGSGMGLFIARQLAQRMGGKLTFAANAPRGFLATLSLPQAATEPATSELRKATA